MVLRRTLQAQLAGVINRRTILILSRILLARRAVDLHRVIWPFSKGLKSPQSENLMVSASSLSWVPVGAST